MANRSFAVPFTVPRTQEWQYSWNGAHWKILEESAGKLWLACGEVILLLDIPTGKITRYDLHVLKPPIGWTAVIMLQKDRQGVLTIAANGFLHKFDPRTGKETAIGLPPDIAHWTTMIYFQSAAMDSADNIWLGTQGYGLYKYNPRMNRFGFVANTTWW